MFYSEPEVQSLHWADEHARDSTVWVGLDERLSTAFAVASGYPVNNNRWDIYEPDQATRLFVVTDVTRRHSARLNQPLPALAGENRIYDNGSAQVYRLRPRTPYQR